MSICPPFYGLTFGTWICSWSCCKCTFNQFFVVLPPIAIDHFISDLENCPNVSLLLLFKKQVQPIHHHPFRSTSVWRMKRMIALQKKKKKPPVSQWMLACSYRAANSSWSLSSGFYKSRNHENIHWLQFQLKFMLCQGKGSSHGEISTPWEDQWQ